MLDLLILVIRVPIGIIISLILIFMTIILFVLETIGLILLFPIAALTMARDKLRKSWFTRYPTSVRGTIDNLAKIWDWTLHEEQGSSTQGCISIFIIIAILLFLY